MKKLKKISKKYGINFNIQIWDGLYNIYAIRNDFHNTDICSFGGFEQLSDAINTTIKDLERRKIINN